MTSCKGLNFPYIGLDYAYPFLKCREIIFCVLRDRYSGLEDKFNDKSDGHQ